MSAPPRQYPPQGYVFNPDDFSDDETVAHSSSGRGLMQRCSVHPAVAMGATIITGMAEKAVQKGKVAVEKAQDKGKDFAEKAKEKGQYAAEKVKEKGQPLAEKVRDKGQELVGIAKEKSIVAADKGKELAEKASPMVQDLVDTLGESCSSLWQGSTIDIKHITPMATGLLSMVRSGSIIQLVSRVSGGTVQIVLDANGHKTLDARGPLDARAFNTLWTIVSVKQSESIRLMNYDNYIAVKDDQVTVKHVQEGVTPGSDTELCVTGRNVTVTVTFCRPPSRCLAFYKNGELRQATESFDDESNAFGLKLVKGLP